MTAIGVFTAVRNVDRIRHGHYDLLHAAWANGAGTAVAVLSRLTGVPFSFGGHARDIYRCGGDPFLTDKIRGARFVIAFHAGTKHGNLGRGDEACNWVGLRVAREWRSVSSTRNGVAR